MITDIGFLKSDYCSSTMTCNQFSFWSLLAGAGLGRPRQRPSFTAYRCPAQLSLAPARPALGHFCWWQERLISAYLAPTLRFDTRTIGNIWPGDAESGEMEAMREKSWSWRGGRKRCLSWNGEARRGSVLYRADIKYFALKWDINLLEKCLLQRSYYTNLYHIEALLKDRATTDC